MPAFFKSVMPALGAAAFTPPNTLNVDSSASIRNVAGTLAFNTMKYYDGNVSTDPKMVGDLNEPYYWWEAASMWGAMLDYYHYTGDPSYNEEILEALLSPYNMGQNRDYVPKEHRFEQGNDDLGFWGYAVLAAAERNFPQPNKDLPSWLQLGSNIFNSLVSRWDTTNCGGGLLWQIYDDNPNGKTYKNSVSNGGMFNLASRLYRATGNTTYLDWASKIFDWTEEVGLLSHEWGVFDGAGIESECRDTNFLSFTYTQGIYLFGSAVLHDATSDSKWSDRATSLFKTSGRFFGPYENATNIMYEPACETVHTCNVDMKNHKATLAKFMWATAQIMPSLREGIRSVMVPTAEAAAKACSGGKDNTQCGQKWYVGGFDGNMGLGQTLSALEAVQGLLIDGVDAPYRGDQIKVVRELDWPARPAETTKRDTASETAILPQETEDDNGVAGRARGMGSAILGIAAASVMHLAAWWDVRL